MEIRLAESLNAVPQMSVVGPGLFLLVTLMQEQRVCWSNAQMTKLGKLVNTLEDRIQIQKDLKLDTRAPNHNMKSNRDKRKKLDLEKKKTIHKYRMGE